MELQRHAGRSDIAMVLGRVHAAPGATVAGGGGLVCVAVHALGGPIQGRVCGTLRIRVVRHRSGRRVSGIAPRVGARVEVDSWLQPASRDWRAGRR